MTNLRELLDSEFDDYGLSWEITRIEREYQCDYYYCDVKVNFSQPPSSKHLTFRVTKGDVEIEMYEDHYEECRHWDWTVKYLWMVTLCWPNEVKG